jgi:hypothetical protein
LYAWPEPMTDPDYQAYALKHPFDSGTELTRDSPIKRESPAPERPRSSNQPPDTATLSTIATPGLPPSAPIAAPKPR